MRKFTTEHTVYTFDELSDAAKEKALDAHRESTAEMLELDYVTDEFIEDAEALGYTDVKCYWSGFWSQGDGACFVAGVDIPAWLKAHKLGNKYRLLLTHGDDASISITHSSMYYYATSTTVDYENYHQCKTAADDDRLEDQLADVAALIETEREELGNKLYKQLEEEYDYQTSDDTLTENIKANEYDFYEDGSQA